LKKKNKKVHPKKTISVSARAPVKKLRDFTGIFTGFYGQKKYYRLLKCIVAIVVKRNYGTVATSLAIKHESDLAVNNQSLKMTLRLLRITLFHLRIPLFHLRIPLLKLGIPLFHLGIPLLKIN
jgi:hypothetical protein